MIYAVDCVVFNDLGQVLMIKRAKTPFKNHWCLPGGKVEEGETPFEAAQRELREETGYQGKYTGNYFVETAHWRDPRAEKAEVAVFHFIADEEPKEVEDAGVKDCRWINFDPEDGSCMDENGNPLPVGFDHLKSMQTIFRMQEDK